MRNEPSMTEMMWSVAAGGLVALVVLGRAVARKKMHMLDVASIGFS